MLSAGRHLGPLSTISAHDASSQQYFLPHPATPASVKNIKEIQLSNAYNDGDYSNVKFYIQDLHRLEKLSSLHSSPATMVVKSVNTIIFIIIFPRSSPHGYSRYRGKVSVSPKIRKCHRNRSCCRFRREKNL
jgi:hypothetical protein